MVVNSTVSRCDYFNECVCFVSRYWLSIALFLDVIILMSVCFVSRYWLSIALFLDVIILMSVCVLFLGIGCQ